MSKRSEERKKCQSVVTNLAKRALANSTVKIKVKEVDLSSEVDWFRETTAHVGLPGEEETNGY